MSKIEQVVKDLQRGKMVIVVDDRTRENEGDLTMAAQRVTPTAINFMITQGRGLVCLALTRERAKVLKLPLMVQQNTATFHTQFTISVDAVKGTTTGISASDRAQTILTAIDPKTRPKDLRRPGHMFPLVAARDGVIERAGHTEAAVDLARLAGCTPAGVLCEVLDRNGRSARLPYLQLFAQRHDLHIISVQELIKYRRSL